MKRNYFKRNTEKVKSRFSTRKLSTGMASVLLGFTFIFGSVSAPLSMTYSKAFAENSTHTRFDNVKDNIYTYVNNLELLSDSEKSRLSNPDYEYDKYATEEKNIAALKGYFEKALELQRDKTKINGNLSEEQKKLHDSLKKIALKLIEDNGDFSLMDSFLEIEYKITNLHNTEIKNSSKTTLTTEEALEIAPEKYTNAYENIYLLLGHLKTFEEGQLRKIFPSHKFDTSLSLDENMNLLKNDFIHVLNAQRDIVKVDGVLSDKQKNLNDKLKNIALSIYEKDFSENPEIANEYIKTEKEIIKLNNDEIAESIKPVEKSVAPAIVAPVSTVHTTVAPATAAPISALPTAAVPASATPATVAPVSAATTPSAPTGNKSVSGSGNSSSSRSRSSASTSSRNDSSKKQTAKRISGKNRFETSVMVSKKFFNKADTVILAGAYNFADSLSASPLARLENAPILLTAKTKLPNSIASEIDRLGAKKVIVVGGFSSIDKSIESELKNKGIAVERISGSDRYATSAEIASKVLSISNSSEAVIAGGETFADALSISPYASKNGSPILLVGKNTSIDSAVKNRNISKFVIAGGYNSVPEPLEKSLAGEKVRLSGSNRYDTSQKIADFAFKNADRAYLASGNVYADALVISPSAGKENSPVILTDNSHKEGTANYLNSNKISDIFIVGGENTVSDL